MPALFIVITNMFFGRLASRFGARTLTMVGLALYTVGGAAAGLFNSIWAVLVMRALVGVGVGIIMPLSTGLLTYYFAPEKRRQTSSGAVKLPYYLAVGVSAAFLLFTLCVPGKTMNK